jgi:hypothetical protein
MLHLIEPFQNCFFQCPDGVYSQSFVPDEITQENETDYHIRNHQLGKIGGKVVWVDVDVPWYDVV